MGSDLTMKDRRELNERAQRHGLPVLWPEADWVQAAVEEQRVKAKDYFSEQEAERALWWRRQYEAMRGSAPPGSAWVVTELPDNRGLWERLFGGWSFHLRRWR